MISEKDDNRSYLSERVHTLQQRLEQSQLSGDERVTALQNEVRLYVIDSTGRGLRSWKTVVCGKVAESERKLQESREQLTNVKMTWSEKIAQLEQQVEKLNRKMADDTQLLLASETDMTSLKQEHRLEVCNVHCHSSNTCTILHMFVISQ